MILQELIKDCNEELVIEKLLEMFHPRAKVSYEGIIKELKGIKPNIKDGKKFVLVLFPEIIDFDGETFDSVYAYNKKEDSAFEISLLNWEDCLGIPVSLKSLVDYGKESFAAHCIYEMTQYATTAKEVIQAQKDFSEMFDSLDYEYESFLDYEYPKDEVEYNTVSLELTAEEEKELEELNKKNHKTLKDYITI